MGGNKSFGEIKRETGVFSRKIIQSRPGKAIWKYRWAFSFIILLLVILYYPAGKIFHEPLSTVFLDRDGNLLGARIAEDQQWRFPERKDVPGKFKKAIITYEDRYFYYHPGFNPVSLIRAVYQDIKKGKIVSGGSTISMQVIRLSRKNARRTVWEKLIEIFRAFRLELSHIKKRSLHYMPHMLLSVEI